MTRRAVVALSDAMRPRAPSHRAQLGGVTEVHDKETTMATETSNGTSTALAVSGPQTALAPVTDNRFALEPTSFEGAMHLAQVVVKSGMFGVKNEADAFVRISTGRALGLTSTQSLRGIKSIHGQPCISADLMMGMAMSHPDCEYFRTVKTTATEAVFETKRRGAPPLSISFTMDDAKAAGLASNDMYRKYPAQMLRARCIAGLARLVYPDRLHGLYTPDEIKTGSVSPEEIQDAEFTPEPPPMQPQEISRAAAVVVEVTKASDFTGTGTPADIDVEDPLVKEYAEAKTEADVKATAGKVAALKLHEDSERRANLRGAHKEAMRRVLGGS